MNEETQLFAVICTAATDLFCEPLGTALEQMLMKYQHDHGPIKIGVGSYGIFIQRGGDINGSAK